MKILDKKLFFNNFYKEEVVKSRINYIIQQILSYSKIKLKLGFWDWPNLILEDNKYNYHKVSSNQLIEKGSFGLNLFTDNKFEIYTGILWACEGKDNFHFSHQKITAFINGERIELLNTICDRMNIPTSWLFENFEEDLKMGIILYELTQ